MNRYSTLRTLFALSLFTPALALGASILVTTKDDELNNDGDCSLREAVASANMNPTSGVDACNSGNTGADSITLLVAGSMDLLDDIEITEALSIIGPGRDALTIEAGLERRHFVVNMPDNTHDFSIQNVTLSGGDVQDTGGGSILATQVGTLTLDGVRLSGNRATNLNDIGGGAVAMLLPADNDSTLEIVDAILEDNEAGFEGGAVFISGLEASSNVDIIDIRRSRFSGNVSNGSGGGVSATGVRNIYIGQSVFENNAANFEPFQGDEIGGGLAWRVASQLSPSLIVEQSTFSGNYAQITGGAIATNGGESVIINSTFHGNATGSIGGEALGIIGGASEILFSTLTDNGTDSTFDYAIRAEDSAAVNLNHTIIWTDWDLPPLCNAVTGASVVSLGYNLARDGSCTGQASDLTGVDPQLGVLGDFGDTASGIVIRTRLPVPGSPAIDGGNISCPGPGSATRGANTLVDQRGQSRPEFGPARGESPLCDVGAVEYQPGSDPANDVFADRFEDTP